MRDEAMAETGIQRLSLCIAVDMMAFPSAKAFGMGVWTIDNDVLALQLSDHSINERLIMFPISRNSG